MKKFFKTLKWIITTLLLLVIGAGIGAGIFFYPKLKTMYIDASNKVNNIKEDTFKSAQTSLVYDNNNNIIAKLKGEKDVYYLPIDKISDYTKQAFIATEDKNFAHHKGIDIKGIMRAAAGLVKNQEISGGGSTITQQLARNVFLTHEQSFERKIKEIFISLLLEQRYSKDEILEFYINSIYFSNGAYGIDAASRKFFSKPSTELTLAETSFLCAIPNNPSLYNPLTKFENTTKRQARILGYMLEEGYISQKEHDDALKQEIVLKVEGGLKNNYVDTYVLDCATEALMQSKGFNFKTEFKNDREKESYEKVYNQYYSEVQKELYTGGYRIYTSIDMKKQKELQNALDNELKGFSKVSSNGIYEFQGAATAIDNATGKVVAIVGGRSQDTEGYTLNRAFQSFRQPGSTFKPLVVYTPLFEGDTLPSTIVNDAKKANGPKNYDGTYSGPITVREAVQKSKNTVAWDLFEKMGPKKGLSYVRKMGFEKIVERDNVPSAALGGLTYGASTVEMASAYSTLARDGFFYKPTAIIKITNADGELVYNNNVEPVRIYSMRASRIMTNVLQSVMTGGTGGRLQLNGGMPSAGKTGSTNGNKDGWFAGYTPYYTTVVWCGYDTPRSTNNLYGSTYPGRIWKSFMNTIHKDLKPKKFPEYEGLKKEEDALNASIKAEEERKVLIDEIESEINIYLSKEINSLKDIESLEAIYTSLTSKINKLKDKDEKKKYLDSISARKSEIDAKKEELTLQETPDSPEPEIPENPEPETPEPETPVNPETPETEAA